jgi:hypothetical protein
VSIPVFETAIGCFNYAKIAGGYDAVKPFLAQYSIIHRVNHGNGDPNTPLKGTPDEVVKALNNSQKGIWPTLVYDSTSLAEQGKWVRGIGMYTDPDSIIEIVSVRFEYEFDGNDKIDQVNIVKRPGPPTGNYTLGKKP